MPHEKRIKELKVRVSTRTFENLEVSAQIHHTTPSERAAQIVLERLSGEIVAYEAVAEKLIRSGGR